MNTRKRLLPYTMLCLLMFLGALTQLPLQARVLLKPNGSNAMPLRTKAIKTQVEIEGRFASTRSEMTFQNETSHRIEADFLYTVPDNAVVTYFAYYFGKEKVVARVVEKERAAQIYQHITSRMRDPALIEMLNNNTFRARIFPIMPNDDLRVEMRYVEVLRSSPQGAVYTLPLKAEEEGKGTLEKLDVSVRVKGEDKLLSVGNNLALPVEKGNDEYKIVLSQSNFRPQHDLRVGLKWKPQTVQISLFAAPANGKDGFFALTLSSRVDINKPRLHIAGMKTYDVLPQVLPKLKAGREVLVVGRYRGTGEASVTLAGISNGAPFRVLEKLQFGAARRADNVAASLWASQQIAYLSKQKKQRARVVDLSQKFLLPSKYTSWLAIPEAERQRYKQEKAAADVAVYAKQLAREIIARRGEGRDAQKLRSQLNKSMRVAGTHDSYVLREAFSNLLTETAQTYVNEKYKSRPSKQRLRTLKLTLARLEEVSTLPAKSYLQEAAANRNRSILNKTAAELADEVHAGREKSQKAKRLSREFEELSLQAAKQDYRVSGAYSARAHILADQIVREEKKQTPDKALLGELTREMTLLAKAGGSKPENFLIWHRESWEAAEILAKKTPSEVRAYYGRDYYMRQGDPLISIDAPADAQQVVALLPGGEVKPLVYDAQSRRWQVRFDIPTYAVEGPYSITVIVVRKDGTRQQLVLRYNVDVTAPQGKGSVLAVATDANNSLRLELDADVDTTRVAALLPWGEKVEMSPSAQATHRFLKLVEVPKEWRGRDLAVTYILTDKAHNRTTLKIDMSQ